MNKKEFLNKLKIKLFGISRDERKKALDYYAEMIDDAIDDGMDEQKAVASMGSVSDAVASIKGELSAQEKPKKKISGWVIALLIIGFPLWFSIVVAVGCTLLAVYVTAWSIIVSLIAIVLVLLLCAIPGTIMLIASIGTNFVSGLFVFGAGLICTAFGLLLAYPVALAVKWAAVFTAKSIKAMFCKITRKAA